MRMMALSKPSMIRLCTSLRYIPRQNLAVVNKRFTTDALCINKRFQNIKFLKHRLLSTGPKSSIRLPPIITTDRLILFGFGVVIVGCLVGYERYNNLNRLNTQQMKELHAIVLQAQSNVKEEKYEEAMRQYQAARDLVGHVKMSSQSVQNKVVLKIVDQLGHLAYELSNWDEAEVLLNQTVHIMAQCGIPEDDDGYIEVMLRLAKIDTLKSRKDEAVEKFDFCIQHLEKKISVDDIYSEECSDECTERITLYGLVLTEYGTFTREVGLLDLSEMAFSKALNICRNVLGPTHEQTSVLANDLATVYDEKGRYNKAIRLAEKAIRIASETSPENLATYKYNLGHIFLHKGDMKKARKALREALQIAEENEDLETKAIIESSIMKLDVPSS